MTSSQITTAQIKKCTPVLFVKAIEPSLPFWQERLGFERTVEVPDGAAIGFVILSKGSVELMYQTIALLHRDAPAQGAEFHNDKTFLFIEVDNLDAVAEALQGFPIVLPRHDTFYGSTEIGYREPGGHLVTFAQFKPRNSD
jgi:uncharacterized glyoxalase superfamily protein PhnB